MYHTQKLKIHNQIYSNRAQSSLIKGEVAVAGKAISTRD